MFTKNTNEKKKFCGFIVHLKQICISYIKDTLRCIKKKIETKVCLSLKGHKEKLPRGS